MTDRCSRFARSSDPGALVLTERDAEILSACWEYRWLTRDQIQRVVAMPCVSRTNRRLRGLYDHGFLERIRAGTVNFGLQPVYLAGPAAPPLLAARTGLPEAEIRERLRRDRGAAPTLLPHDLEANDVRIALCRGVEWRSDLGLDVWLNALEAFDPYAPGRALRPDGYFRVWQGETLHSFFHEQDRGTVSLARWSEKVRSYLEYLEGGFYARRTGLTRCRILTTAPTPTRLESLIATTRRVTDRRFWFALTEEALADGDLTRPIWRSLGGEGLRALIEPEVG